MTEIVRDIQVIEEIRILNRAMAETVERNPWALELLENLKSYDKPTYEHSLRVAQLFSALASEKEDKAKIEAIILAGLLHDVGKLGVSRETLTNPGKLTDEQWAEIEGHPLGSFQRVNVHHVIAAQIVHGHHQFQPRPYPKEKITDDPVVIDMQRLLALADATDTFLSKRVNKVPNTPEYTQSQLQERNVFTEAEITRAIQLRLSLNKRGASAVLPV